MSEFGISPQEEAAAAFNKRMASQRNADNDAMRRVTTERPTVSKPAVTGYDFSSLHSELKANSEVLRAKLKPFIDKFVENGLYASNLERLMKAEGFSATRSEVSALGPELESRVGGTERFQEFLDAFPN